MNPRRFYGSAVGLVTNLNDPDQTGRIKVRFPWLHDQEESHWCRVSAGQAGKSRGNFIRPEIGDEVLVMFERGDPNQPFVLGSLWNGQDPPPGPGNPDGKNDHKFFQSREGHQLIFNDGDDGGYIEFHDGKQKLHTKIDVPGEHVHWLADSGTITITAPEGLVRMECVDFLLHSTKTTTVNVTNAHDITVQGTRTYSAKMLTQSAGSSLKMTTPNLSKSCVTFNMTSGATSANIATASADIGPKLEMEMKGPVTRTIAGKSTIDVKSFRTESGGPSGPLTLTTGALDLKSDQTFVCKAGGPVTVQAAQFMLKGDNVIFAADQGDGAGMAKAKLAQFVAGSILLNPGMFTFPATKQLDLMIGADFHHAGPGPLLPPFPFFPHAFVNPILIDTRPTVLVNNMPAAGVGATAIGIHIPILPLPWSPIPMTFRGFLTMAIVAGFLPAVVAAGSSIVSMTSNLLGTANPVGVAVSGVDAVAGGVSEVGAGSDPKAQWLLRAFPQFSSYGAFLGMLCQLLPFPVASGSISIGAPNVIAEDVPMSMGLMPFSNSCSDIPIIPNAMVASGSNVQVGVDLAAVVQQLMFQAVFGALAMGAAKGLNKIGTTRANRVQPGTPDTLNNSRFAPPDANAPSRKPQNSPARPQGECHGRGHPVDPVSGTLFDKQTDLALPGPLPLRLERNYNSVVTRVAWGGVLGVGWRMNFETHLTLHTEPVELGSRRTSRFWALHDAEMRVIRLPYLEDFGAWHHDPQERLEFCRADDLLWDLRDKDGLTWRFAVHADGEARLVEWFDRHQNTVRLHYKDDPYVPAGLTDSGGRHVRFEFDPAGRLSELWVEGRGDSWQPHRVRRYEYDEDGRLGATYDAEDNARRFVYDAAGRMVREQEPGGYSWHFHYDDQGRVTHTYGEDLHEYAALEYQPSAQTTVVTDHSGRVERFAADEDGRVEVWVDQEGGVTRFAFDPSGNKVSETDALGHETTWEYDEHGRLLEHMLPVGGKHEYSYDHRGWLVEHVDPCGSVTRHGYDTQGDRVRTRHPDGGETRRRFDRRGLLIAELRADGTEHAFAYDEAGNLVEEVHEGVSQEHTVDMLGRRRATVTGEQQIRYTHDRDGRIVAKEAPDGGVERWTYDANGEVTSYADAAQNTWHTERDRMGRPTGVRTPMGQSRSTTRGLDNRFASHLDGAGHGYRYAYDRARRLVRHETDDGAVERYRRDAAGRVDRIDYSGGGARAFERDGDGYAVGLSLSDGTTIAFERDALGRCRGAVETPAGEVPYDENAPVGRHIRFERRYDAGGQIAAEAGLDSRARLRFATAGRLVHLDIDGVAFRINRDPRGRVVRVDAPDGQYRVADGGVITPHGARVLSSPGAWLVRDTGDRSVAAYLSEVDDTGTLREERLIVSESRSQWVHRFAHDADGRIDEAFDASGNRCVDDMSYGEGQRLSADQHGGVEHDVRGRVTSRRLAAGVQRLWWDDLDRLREVENPDGTVVRYRYDAERRLVERIEDPVAGRPSVWRFGWVGDRLISEHRPDGTVVRYLRLNAASWVPWAAWVEAPHVAGQLLLLHPDARGAVVAATDSVGAVHWLGEYSPHGVCFARDRGFDNRLRLAGMWADPTTGIYYNRYRWYVGAWGRYLTPDPLGIEGGENPYGYVEGDPLHRFDPLGLATHGTKPANGSTTGTKGNKPPPKGPRNNRTAQTDAVKTDIPPTKRTKVDPKIKPGEMATAKRVDGGLESGGQLTEKQAVERLRRGDDVYTPSKAKAKQLQKKASHGQPVHDGAHVDKNTGSSEGRHPHYHGVDRKGGHAFYGDADD